MLRKLRYSLHSIRGSSGSVVASFLALALGIGATTALFSVVSAVMLHPLPWPESQRLLRIFSGDSRSTEDDVSMADFLDWKRQLRCFDQLALLKLTQATLTGHGVAERVILGKAEATLLPLLGTQTVEGRNFDASDNQPGGRAVALVSRKFQDSHFGGGRAIGETLVLDEIPYTVIGILPDDVALLHAGEVWIPLDFDLSKEVNRRGIHNYLAFGRLRRGVTLKEANARLEAISRALANAYPDVNRGVSARAVALEDSVGTAGRPSAQWTVKTALLMLLGAVTCVLLIACGNVANLSLARSWSRQRETAVRIALGATTGRLFREALQESSLLALPAAATGVGLAALILRVVRNLELANVPRLDEAVIDWRVLLFTLGATLFTALAVGTLPALRGSSIDLVSALKQAGGRTTESAGQSQLRRAFVTLQAALTAMLLIESALLVKSFAKASQVRTAFAAGHLLTVYLSLPASRYGSDHPKNAGALARNVVARIRSLAGVESAAITTDFPLMATGGGGGVLVDGAARSGSLWAGPYVMFTAVSSRYFQTMKIPFLAGADFDEHSGQLSSQVIVNRSFVKRLLGQRDPLATRVAAASSHPEWNQIVGVVADVPQVGIEKAVLPEIYFPITGTDSPWLGLAIRVAGDPLAYTNTIRREIAKIDPAVALFLPRSMEEIVNRQYVWRKLETGVVGSFSVVAILLACLGIYAVIAYSVRQRSSEIGLRLAIGASEGHVVFLAMRYAAAPALLGVAGGLAGGFLIAGASEQLLFGVAPTDLTSYLEVAGLLIAVSGAAAYLPARRALRIDPWKALRDE